MMKKNNPNSLDRRGFLQAMGIMGLGAGLLQIADAAQTSGVHVPDIQTPSGKPLRGLYPILETPFTPENTLDKASLAKEVDFINRGGVNGMIWPVYASSWSTLSDAERIEGAETILAAGKGGRAAIAIAVQSADWDTPTSVRYAKHAAAHGADAIESMPPNNGWNVADQVILDYYKAIGAATGLPLIVQTRGTMSVDLVVRMFQEIPTFKAVKDEAGDSLERAPELIRRTGGKLAIMTGGGGTGMQLLEQLPIGYAGLCPTPEYSDMLQQVMDLYWAGKMREAFDMFSRVQGFATIPDATGYLMIARGIFPENVKIRPQPMDPQIKPTRPVGGGMGGARRRRAPLTEEGKEFIRNALDVYLKPYLRA
jgi:4-hydroxy-tetrahydrodipicolinate synthase